MAPRRKAPASPDSGRPIRCAVYLRMSLDVTGEELGIERQREDCQRIAAERRWEVVGEYVDNSISASDKRKSRPAYERLTVDYAAGMFDAIVCWDLDRLTRQPRQLEDWIDAAQDRGLRLVTANGEADLSTDSGRMFARIKATVARAEVERKAERQRRAAVQRAERGKVPAGVRLTGYDTAGKVIPDEAKLVRELFARFVAGDSLHGLCAWLDASGVKPRRGARWNPSTVRTILTNPRYAGRAIYLRGDNGLPKTNGRAGTWDAIVDEATFDLAASILADPRRRKQYGTDRKYLGSSLYLCGVCDQTVRTHGSPPPRYRCPSGHLVRSGAPIDELVRAVVRRRLQRHDLADLFSAKESPQAREAAAKIGELRGRLTAFEDDYAAGRIDGRLFHVATAKVRAELDTAVAAQARALTGAGSAALLAAPNPAKAFDQAPLGAQRAVIGLLCTVRLLPAPQGRRGLDPASVRIEPKAGVARKPQ